jgi:DHA1 family tetracycline resistance protein-like MFS transporter
MNLAHVVLPSVMVLYLGYKFGWDSASVGLALAGVGISAMIVQGVLVGPITQAYGEPRTVRAGLLCGAAGFSVYALAPSGWVYCLGIPIMACWGLAGPAMQSLMTRRVSHREQGQLQGAIASLIGIAGLVGPSLFTQTFAYFISSATKWHFPGAPFLLASCLLLLAMAIAWAATVQREKSGEPPDS